MGETETEPSKSFLAPKTTTCLTAPPVAPAMELSELARHLVAIPSHDSEAAAGDLIVARFRRKAGNQE